MSNTRYQRQLTTAHLKQPLLFVCSCVHMCVLVYSRCVQKKSNNSSEDVKYKTVVETVDPKVSTGHRLYRQKYTLYRQEHILYEQEDTLYR